jgi:putative ABC transport system substrate-binding protein
LAADLVGRRVAVIVAPGAVAGVRAAKASTATIPIVFRTGGDPVELGLVSSLNQPGGNITGVNATSLETGTKRLGLLHELLPQAMHFAVLINPNDPNAAHYKTDLEDAASRIGLPASNPLGSAILAMAMKGGEPHRWDHLHGLGRISRQEQIFLI